MVLTERPDFRRWLARLGADRRALELAGLAPLDGRPDCARCGADLDDFHAHDHCLICLSELFGIEQGELAANVGCRVLAVLQSAGDFDRDTLRVVVEGVLDEYCGPVAATDAEAAAPVRLEVIRGGRG